MATAMPNMSNIASWMVAFLFWRLKEISQASLKKAQKTATIVPAIGKVVVSAIAKDITIA